MGCIDSSSGSGVQRSRIRVHVSDFRVLLCGLMSLGLGADLNDDVAGESAGLIEGLGFRVQGLGFRV